MMNGRGVWVYALTDRACADLSWLAGVGGERVLGVAAGGLTAVVSHVDLAEFGEDALREKMEELSWLEEAARAHHSVIEAVAGLFPVLPARFATVYTSEATMAAELTDRGGELRAALSRVGGCVEWGVKAYPAAAGAAKGTKGAQGASAGEDPAGGGMAYLKKRRAELSAKEDSRRAWAEGARVVHAELSEHAKQARLYPPQASALSGSRTPMLLNAAYLLDPDGSPGFASAVAEVATAHPELRLDMSGPWPPYSFTAQDVAQDA